MGTSKKQSTIGTIFLGIVGALLGGFLMRNLLGDSPSNNGFIASTAVAMLGACLVIYIKKLLRGETSST